jgi:formate/nitrite transporter FocA (FNT family)
MSVGGLAGAILFSVGLMTIVTFNLDLFTGKAGLLITKEIKPMRLIAIWFENFYWSIIATLFICLTPIADKIYPVARNIVEIRVANGPLTNTMLGIFCGLLMYAAVSGFRSGAHFAILVFPVAAFIMSGFNHCVADMFYTMLGAQSFSDYFPLIFTTIGNVIGANMIPAYKMIERH